MKTYIYEANVDLRVVPTVATVNCGSRASCVEQYAPNRSGL